MLGQVELFDGPFDSFAALVHRNTLDLGIEPEMLFDSHEDKDGVMLRAIANEFSCL